MQFKITLVSLFAALAIASPLEKRCTANGGSCTQLSQCCSGNCEYDSSIGLVCKAAAREEDVIPDGASSGSGPVQLEKRCSANGVQCNFNNAECCSDICLYNWDEGKAYCSAPLKEKREPEPEPEPLLEKRCTANGGACNFQNSECCSGNCLYKLGDSTAYCAAASKREAEPEAEPEPEAEAEPEPEAEAEPKLEKRCTADGGTCNLNNAECCSGHCYWDLSGRPYCRAA
ncbi:hypothetical protein IWZ03DRAFT_415318 [Phyllosticta citriasiana]|jgi:hypothetical protein|uniref:Uncharacterized protein n=1 Tax=Phyllosticta citriasiana TaxID=595635 RepID=A0ABR1KNG0_9PEZI